MVVEVEAQFHLAFCSVRADLDTANTIDRNAHAAYGLGLHGLDFQLDHLQRNRVGILTNDPTATRGSDEDLLKRRDSLVI